MDNLKYVLKTNEVVLMPTENNKGKRIMKKAVWMIICIIVLGSIIFRDNLFMELSWSTRIFLILLVIGFGFYDGKSDYQRSPMELRFYEDYLEFYLEKRYYSERVTRKQINTMKYSEISKCVYKKAS